MMIQLGRGRGATTKAKKKAPAPKRKRKASTAAPARKRVKSSSSTIQAFSTLLPLRSGGLHHEATAADYSCPVVKGRLVTGMSGGVKFQFMGFSGGLAYRGRCRPNRVSNTPSGETNTAQIKNTTPPRATPAAACRTPPPQRPQINSAWTPRAMSFLTMSPNTSRWEGYNAMDPVTPHANITRGGALTTPTSMPAVKTPTRLTQSAKRFHDALVESSPLALLASAAQTRIAGSVSKDVTPSPAEGQHSWSAATPTIPIPTFSGKDCQHDIVTPDEKNADGSKTEAVFKRYNIRPKEKARPINSPDGQAPPVSSLMTDLLYERPLEQHQHRQPPSLLVSSPPTHRSTPSATSAELAQGAAALAAVMTGKVKS